MSQVPHNEARQRVPREKANLVKNLKLIKHRSLHVEEGHCIGEEFSPVELQGSRIQGIH